MLEGVHFSYDGIKSVDMGLLNVRISGGMFEETFLPTRNILEHKTNGSSKPYFQDVTYEPLEFKLSFAFEYYYDEAKIREVARWLNQKYYKEFYTVDNPNRIFYCMVEGDSSLVHNGLKQGYIELNFRCDSPYAYQPVVTKSNMKFDDTEIAKSYVDNTFINGERTNIKYNSDGSLSINTKTTIWRDLSGKKWSDL